MLHHAHECLLLTHYLVNNVPFLVLVRLTYANISSSSAVFDVESSTTSGSISLSSTITSSNDSVLQSISGESTLMMKLCVLMVILQYH